MKRGDIVKFSRPVNAEESKLKFTLLDDPEVGQRVDIQLICDVFIRPIERVDVVEIEPAT